jgi:hypothetical protein
MLFCAEVFRALNNDSVCAATIRFNYFHCTSLIFNLQQKKTHENYATVISDTQIERGDGEKILEEYI